MPANIPYPPVTLEYTITGWLLRRLSASSYFSLFDMYRPATACLAAAGESMAVTIGV